MILQLHSITQSMDAPCRHETELYRGCLKEKQASGRKCDGPAKHLELCRSKWRRANKFGDAAIDGNRVLPPQECRRLSCELQRCLKWKKGDESQCHEEIKALKACMA